MLVIEDLEVEIGGKQVLKHIDMEIPVGETHVLFGPNGSGKTSLLMTIMGYPQYQITGGKIYFKGHDITHMPINERANLGIGMSYQRPPTIHGLKVRQMIDICRGDKDFDSEALAEKVNFQDFLERDVNAGLSGGEIKRSELLQLMAQDPDLMLFDEPESGVDMESISMVGNTIAKMLQKDITHEDERSMLRKKRERTKMGFIITHTGYILDYLAADKAQLLYNGVVSCASNPREILTCISKLGYEECVRCTIETN